MGEEPVGHAPFGDNFTAQVRQQRQTHPAARSMAAINPHPRSHPADRLDIDRGGHEPDMGIGAVDRPNPSPPAGQSVPR